jgi:ABC-type transporter Mla maintaining outer membrane lipid asymmetry ATPase subunit MlaF
MNEFPLRLIDVTLPGSGMRITLDAPAHQAVVVVGPEASGVDSIAGIVVALERPSAGQVLLYGEDIHQLPRRALLEFRRRIGFVPSGNGLLHNLTLRDNVALPLRYGSDLSDREIDGRVKIMLAMLRIDDVASKRPAAATEEQQRRTAVARALAFDPGLVVLADPFDGLTNRAAAELLEVVRGGETSEGARRAVFMTGQYMPDRLLPRIEIRYRLYHGELRRES